MAKKDTVGSHCHATLQPYAEPMNGGHHRFKQTLIQVPLYWRFGGPDGPSRGHYSVIIGHFWWVVGGLSVHGNFANYLVGPVIRPVGRVVGPRSLRSFRRWVGRWVDWWVLVILLVGWSVGPRTIFGRRRSFFGRASGGFSGGLTGRRKHPGLDPPSAVEDSALLDHFPEQNDRLATAQPTDYDRMIGPINLWSRQRHAISCRFQPHGACNVCSLRRATAPLAHFNSPWMLGGGSE